MDVRTNRNVLRRTEAGEQAAVIEWAALHEKRWPCLRWLHHIPNGGSRHPAEAARLKGQGVKAGIPDLFLPWPVGVYAGLYVEMKAAGGKALKEQKEFLEYAKDAGYQVAMCWSADEAIEVIRAYLRR